METNVSLAEDADSEGGHARVEEAGMEYMRTLYFLLNFVVNLKVP